MKNLITLLCCCALAFTLCACKPELNKEALAPFVGSWDCQDSTHEERGWEDYTYVGYLQLDVKEDGSFSMYDVEAGNPGLAGKLYPEYPEKGVVQFRNTEEFEPPSCWSTIEKKQGIYYGFLDEEGTTVLYLTYGDDEGEMHTLVFERME